MKYAVLFGLVISTIACAHGPAPSSQTRDVYDYNLPPEYQFPPNPTPEQVGETCGAMLSCMYNGMCWGTKAQAQKVAIVAEYQKKCGPPPQY